MTSSEFTYVLERKVKEGYWVAVSYIRCYSHSARLMIGSVEKGDPGPMPIRLKRVAGDFDESLPIGKWVGESSEGAIIKCLE